MSYLLKHGYFLGLTFITTISSLINSMSDAASCEQVDSKQWTVFTLFNQHCVLTYEELTLLNLLAMGVLICKSSFCFLRVLRPQS